jgi:hypothetical protein
MSPFKDSGMSFKDEIDKIRFPLDMYPLNDDAQEQIKTIRKAFNQIAHLVSENTEVNRAQMLCFTALQEAKMWAVQAVVDEQI